MRGAADAYLGSHDFRSFCRWAAGTDASEPIVRRVTRVRWLVDDGPEAADADSERSVERFRAANRVSQREPAPPKGLCLVRVDYD